MRKTIVTGVLDFSRHLTEITGTIVVFYFSWTMLHWLLAVFLAIPVYLATSYFVSFLSLPLYLLTPEHRVTSKILNAIQKGEFSTALTALEAHEKWHVVKPQDRSYEVAAETEILDNSFAHVAGAV